MRLVIAFVGLVAILAIALSIRSPGSQAGTGYGLRAVSQKQDGYQVVTLWAVETPSGMHACVTADYNEGSEAQAKPVLLSCDWGK
jgi:hypothetical protein